MEGPKRSTDIFIMVRYIFDFLYPLFSIPFIDGDVDIKLYLRHRLFIFLFLFFWFFPKMKFEISLQIISGFLNDVTKIVEEQNKNKLKRFSFSFHAL
jgi:hypothetical protein